MTAPSENSGSRVSAAVPRTAAIPAITVTASTINATHMALSVNPSTSGRERLDVEVR
ncbi:MAG TPA: hypothetical protein VKQ07_08520 [Jatrophihabitantaceae bacterium]|nr:hypothetical protein [Jatrophihabitantaceae bacterium]